MGYGGARGKPPKAESGNSKDRHVTFVPLKPLQGSEKGFDSKSNLKAEVHSSADELDSSDAESSSSSSSLSDEFVQVNPQLPPKSPKTSLPKPKPVHKVDKVDVSSASLYGFEESLNDSPLSTSRFSDVTHESHVSSMSPLQYPPAQFMERHGGFDPNRIPAAIFGRPPTPTDWSVASNDSLFSIRFGNSSFSRDHVCTTTNEDMRKSGELSLESEEKTLEFHGSEETPSGEHSESREICRSGESHDTDDLLKMPDEPMKITTMTPNVQRVESKENIDAVDAMNEDTEASADDSINDDRTDTMNNQSEEMSLNSRSYLGGNHILDKRESTTPSSAITKKKKYSCPPCYYSPDCSHTLCCFKRPSVSCKPCLQCPSCSCQSCFGWPSCCHCKSPRCPNCTPCRCFKTLSLCSCKGCFRWPKCSSSRQCCSCKWLTRTGCSWSFFSCKSCRACPKRPSCKFTCPSLTSYFSKFNCCCCSSLKKPTSKRQWSCFSCSCSCSNLCSLCH